MADRRLVRKIRNLARLLRGERAISAAALQALTVLLEHTRKMLRGNDMDPAALDVPPEWRAALTTDVIPTIEAVFTQAFAATATGLTIDPAPYATRHLEAVWNRLIGVSDDVFDSMRLVLEEGRQAGESIAELSTRVDTLLEDSQRWKNRATTIARTEVISANNGGAHASAGAVAETMGLTAEDVVKEWLSTGDSHTRPSHQAADGQQVVGMEATFTVGADELLYPGEPGGSAEEVVNCRCTPLYIFPGDPDYPAGLTASASPSAQEAPMTTQAPEVMPTDQPMPEAPVMEAPLDTPTHAGVAVQAADTGRILMIQRSLNQGDDPPEVAGTWEFPGGGIEGEETPAEAAWREFGEETGLPQPPGEMTGGWVSANGIYQAFVFTTPVEAAAFPDGINPDHEAAVMDNPDDPGRRVPDVQAWFTREHIEGMGTAIRPEVAEGTDWTQFAPTMMEPAQPVAAGPVPARAQDIAAGGDPFYGIMCPEGVTSGDARQFGIESLTWRDLPLPLMYQDAQAGGHDGAVRVGRIDQIERDATTYTKPMIRYSGVWDTSPIALEAQRQVENGVARGVSVDGDDVTTRLLTSAGLDLDPMSDDVPEDGVIVEHADAARACGATICSVPAFQQAYIANGRLEDRITPEPGQGEVETQQTPLPADEQRPVAMAASAGDIDCAPAWTMGLVASTSDVGAWVMPAEHFTNPNLVEPTSLTVTPEGRVYGHLATWGTCHIGTAAGRRGDQVRAAGKCREVPVSASNYAYFATGVVPTDDGAMVNAGQITMDTGHANLQYGIREAIDHYAHTGAAVADIVVGHDTIGIWFSGHVRPTASEAQVFAMRAAGSISGDWREYVRGSDQLEMIAALVVNVPGFPIGRPAVTASGGRTVALVAAGIVRPPPAEDFTAEMTAETLERITRNVIASIARTQRAETAHARVRTHRAETIMARLRQRSA